MKIDKLHCNLQIFNPSMNSLKPFLPNVNFNGYTPYPALPCYRKIHSEC